MNLSNKKGNESVKKSQSQSPPKIFDILKAKTQPERKSFKKIINHGVRAKALDIELITAPKSKLLINLKKTFAKANPSSTKDPFDIGLEYNQIKNLYISFDSGKMTSTLVNLDIEEMTYCLACVMLKFIEFGEVNKGKTPFPPQTNVKNPEENYHLDLDYKPVSSKNNDDSRNFDLSDKIKETPQKNSFGILEKKIKELDKLQKKTESGYYEDEEDFSHCKYESLQRNSDVNNNLKEEYEDLVDEEYYNHLEENDEIEFEQSKKEIESILKESLLVISASKQENNNKNSNNINNNDHKPNFLKNTATFNKNLDSLKEEEKMYFDSNENNETYGDNTENNCFQSRMEDNSKVNISLCSKITYFDDNHPNDLSFSRDLENVFENAFNEKIIEKWTKAKPTKDTISNFCKNIIITSKMEKEVTIICLIYIEKLIIGSGFHVSSLNWRRIVFIALILASKVMNFYYFCCKKF